LTLCLESSAGGALLAGFGDSVGRAESRFEGASEGQSLGFTAKGYDMLVQAHLPLGLCHLFYQDLHC
jgi:hypothetical protein